MSGLFLLQHRSHGDLPPASFGAPDRARPWAPVWLVLGCLLCLVAEADAQTVGMDFPMGTGVFRERDPSFAYSAGTIVGAWVGGTSYNNRIGWAFSMGGGTIWGS